MYYVIFFPSYKLELTFQSNEDIRLYSCVGVKMGKYNSFQSGVVISKSDTTDLTMEIKPILSVLSGPNVYFLYTYALHKFYYNIDRAMSVGWSWWSNTKSSKRPVPVKGPIKGAVHLNERLERFVSSSKFGAIRVAGKPGSGKTYQAVKLAEYYRSIGKNVLYVLSEVLLLNYVSTYFSCEVYLYSGKLPIREKYGFIEMIKNSKGNVILATRSFLLLPLSNIDYVFIDEAHDSSYDQLQRVYYNAIDLLKIASRYYRFRVIYITATLNFNLYRKLRLFPVFNLNPKFKKSLAFRFERIRSCLLNRDALSSIERARERGKTTLVYVNRRGHSDTVICAECNRILKCDTCDRKLVYHRQDNQLRCHICDKARELSCDCGSIRLYLKGYGVERLSRQLSLIYDNVSVCSSDFLPNQDLISEFVKSLSDNRYDVVITTNIFVKGYHISNIDSLILFDIDREERNISAEAMRYITLKQLIGRIEDGGTALFLYLNWKNMYRSIQNDENYLKCLARKQKLLEGDKHKINLVSPTPLDWFYIKKRWMERFWVPVALLQQYSVNGFFIMKIAVFYWVDLEEVNKLFHWLNIDYFNNL